MTILSQIYQTIDRVRESGVTPVLLLDIDDTLIDCRHRKLKILLEFAAEPEVAKSHPDEVAKLLNLPIEHVEYRVSHILAKLGILCEVFGKKAYDYWLERYFTHDYLLHDEPFPGAVSFVKEAHRRGALIVYLTARDEAGMGRGTRASLVKCGFPMDDQTRLVLKIDRQLGDLDFKRAELARIGAWGQVVAAFENETRNLNAIGEVFPEATLVLRDTLHAPDPPPPAPGTVVLDHFEAPEGEEG